jgi:diguanylate cyclase (GGDEF)-like protein/PAS domain S-box-containing protein
LSQVTGIKRNIVFTIALTLLFPILVGNYVNTLFPGKWVNIPLHSALEVSGGIIAIIISIIFYLKFKSTLRLTHFNYSSIALLSMGIVDIFHGSVMPGELFVWLHSTAVFFGGLLFMTIWFKEQQVSKRSYIAIPLFSALFALLFSSFFVAYPSTVPSMFNPDGSFSSLANALNIIGGIGFFIAALKFTILYAKTRELNSLLFAGHTILFGTAGVLFLSSVVWDLQWWLWHVLRFSAYAIAFYFLYSEFQSEFKQIESSNTKLKTLNDRLHRYVDIIDANVITSSTDPTGKIISASQAFCDISGYTKQELLGRSHSIVRHPNMPKSIYEEMWKRISSGKTWRGELENRKKDGSSYWVDVTITPQFKNGTIDMYTAVRHDITDKKRVEQLSITDDLTSLFNRRHYNTVLENELNRARREGVTLAMMLIDIDHFKLYNDTYGHVEGDYALQKVAKVFLEETRRPSDYAFRLGGEEFAILFNVIDEEQARAYSQKIREKVESLGILHAQNSASEHLTISIGLVIKKIEESDTCEMLYLNADRALYMAKSEGRNRVSLYQR